MAELPLSGQASFPFPLMLTLPPITPRDVGAAHPPPAKWPFGPGSELWPQMPTPRMSTPHGNIIPDGFSSSSGGRIGDPSHTAHSAPKALILWFSKKRGEGLPHHGVVSSLASDPHLGDGAPFHPALGTVVFPLIVPDVRLPWSPRQGLRGLNQTMFLWAHAVPS